MDLHAAILLLVSTLASCSARGIPVSLPFNVEEIKGGNISVPHSWPWQAIVFHTDENGIGGICGGVLVKRNIVLTAAHCVDRGEGFTVNVFLGMHYFVNDENTQYFDASSWVIHPTYNTEYFLDGDIAVVFLKQLPKLRFGTVAPVPRLSTDLFDSLAVEPDAECYQTGFGITQYEDGRYGLANELQETSVKVLTQERCVARNTVQDPFPDDNVCVKGRSCSGDSGGPLVCNLRGKWTLIGIVSYRTTYDGCSQGIRSLARVSYFRDWIHDTIES